MNIVSYSQPVVSFTHHFLGGDLVLSGWLETAFVIGVWAATAAGVAVAMVLAKGLVDFLDRWRFERNWRRDCISRFRAYKALGLIQQQRRAVFGRLERKD